MGFSNQLKKILQDNKDTIEKTKQDKIANAKIVLAEVMGDQLNTITSITFDLSAGKFKDVEAPESSKELLRKANLLIE
ncbi:hypothetical protein BOO29_19185 [Vibrio navarrensis]|uniref:Uncharacterized protein n=1 Tax=Vibrio anguillarum TaxID=55601 RepID=A0ABD4QR65_VIBAN|nr:MULTISPECIES: hypothetical protein [Vibrio]MBE4587014.1 hypothetical protein [Vibrio navarrensis]MBT2917750.1 hypothetical protein [Vibrio anguillarum]